MKFGPVSPEFKRVECAIVAAIRPQFDVPFVFNILLYHNSLNKVRIHGRHETHHIHVDSNIAISILAINSQLFL